MSSAKDHRLFRFQNLQMKTYESCKLSYVWEKMVNKVPHTSPSTFDDFADHPLWLC